jgi:hypothetical protein
LPGDAELAASPRSPWPEATHFHREEGCARGLSPSGDAEQDLSAIGRLCAAGLTPIEGGTKSVRVTPGRIAEIPFTMSSPACFRVAATASQGGLSMALYAGDRELVSVASLEPLVLTPSGGPVCVREPGPYRAAVLVTNGAGADASSGMATVSLRIWMAPQN